MSFGTILTKSPWLYCQVYVFFFSLEIQQCLAHSVRHLVIKVLTETSLIIGKNIYSYIKIYAWHN